MINYPKELTLHTNTLEGDTAHNTEEAWMPTG